MVCRYHAPIMSNSLLLQIEIDKENELIVMKLLKELNEKGITIIMVTHNMNLCDCFSRVINVENFR